MQIGQKVKIRSGLCEDDFKFGHVEEFDDIMTGDIVGEITRFDDHTDNSYYVDFGAFDSWWFDESELTAVE